MRTASVGVVTLGIRCVLADPECEALSVALVESQVRHFHSKRSYMGSGCRHFSEYFRIVSSITLHSANLTDTHITAFFAALADNPVVTSINLSDNPKITNVSSRTISKYMKRNNTVSSLILFDTSISGEGLGRLIRMLAVNNTLSTLYVESFGMDVRDSDVFLLLEILRESNRGLTRIDIGSSLNNCSLIAVDQIHQVRPDVIFGSPDARSDILEDIDIAKTQLSAQFKRDLQEREREYYE